jgi:hypothetical protein
LNQKQEFYPNIKSVKSVNTYMKNFRFILQKYNGRASRYNCPACGKKGEFTRYVDTITGQHIDESVGICNRRDRCGYHFTPKDYFKENEIKYEPINKSINPIGELSKEKPSFIEQSELVGTLGNYEKNNFVQYLVNTFGRSVTIGLINTYFIGTSQYWPNSTVFWQLDVEGKIRTGKIIQYDVSTGKRVTEPFDKVSWMHSSLRPQNFKLKQCLFGEHLLKNNTKPIALVESEKTAIIASVYLPKFLWLATGGLSNLSEAKFCLLKTKNVFLFPDINGYNKWKIFLSNNFPESNWKISDLLEQRTNPIDKVKGLDLADYLLRFQIDEFSL